MIVCLQYAKEIRMLPTKTDLIFNEVCEMMGLFTPYAAVVAIDISGR